MNLAAHWQTVNWLSCLLLCPSLLFRLLVFIRRYLYRKGFLTVYRANIPVIVVGNITVGGTGKTPLIISIARYLQTQGYSPAVVSRGYGTDNKTPHIVQKNDKAVDVGDEPLLIARSTNIPVVVCADRHLAVDAASRINGCDVVLSDDGLQHYAMHRDIEIVCVDGERMFGNRLCLPAGPLREPLSRLESVDFILSKQRENPAADSFSLSGEQLIALNTSAPDEVLSSFAGQRVHAIAGIANPSAFFDLLRNNRLRVIEHAFPDHHTFVESDFIYSDDLAVLMTEKDAVKCTDFDLPNTWYLAVNAVLPAHFLERFTTALAACATTPGN